MKLFQGPHAGWTALKWAINIGKHTRDVLSFDCSDLLHLSQPWNSSTKFIYVCEQVYYLDMF